MSTPNYSAIENTITNISPDDSNPIWFESRYPANTDSSPNSGIALHPDDLQWRELEEFASNPTGQRLPPPQETTLIPAEDWDELDDDEEEPANPKVPAAASLKVETLAYPQEEEGLTPRDDPEPQYPTEDLPDNSAHRKSPTSSRRVSPTKRTPRRASLMDDYLSPTEQQQATYPQEEQDPRDVEDEASRKITNFMRRASAKNQKDKRASAVQEYLRTVDDGLAPQQEAEELRELDHPSDAHHDEEEEEKRDDDAAYPQEEEEPKQEQDPRDVEDEASRKITNFMRRASAKNQKDKRASAVQEYLRTVDDGLAPQQEAEELRELDHPSDAHHDEEEEEKRDDDATYPQEEDEPKQEQDPRDVEDEASRKITNFMRRASAKNQKDKRASAVQEYLRTVDDGLAPQQEAEELRELDHPSDAHHDEDEEKRNATYPQEEEEPKQEQDPRDVEDEASRKITNFMRRASAKNQKDKRASAVQEYLRTVDDGLAPQQEAEELRELDHPSDAHHDEEEEEKRDDDATYPQEEEEPKQEQDPRDVEDEASRKITNFMRRASAKNQKDKRASAVQEYLRTADDGLAPQQEAEELRELDHPSDAHHDEEEEEKRDDDATYPQEEEEPKQEQDPRDVEDEASRKITNFMRRASAKNQKDKRASAVQEYLRTVDNGLAPQQEAEELRELDHPSDAHHDEDEEKRNATYPQEEEEPKQEQDPRDVEDEASRKITNFMRRASAKNQKDKRASAVQEYLRTVDDGLAPQQEAEELRELDHPSDAHHDEEEEEKRDDDATYPQEEEEPKQEQDPRDVEDEASRKITNFMRRASAKNQKDKRASAVQEYLRTADDGLAPQQEAEELRELDHPSDAHHDEEEEEKRDDDAAYPQEEEEPKQEQDPRDVEDEASRKITNFMRRASAKNQKDKRASAVQEYLRTADDGLAPQQEAEELRELDHPSDAHHDEDEDEEKRNATYPQEEEEPKQEQDPRDVEDEASRKITNFMRRASAKNQKDKRASAVQEYLRTVDNGLAPQQEAEELRELDHPSDAHHDEEEEEKRDDDAAYPQEEEEPKQEQDPRDVEDEASRKITNFMRRASAKNQKDKRASAVQEYLRTVDDGLAPQQEAEELRELDHPSDAHHDEEEEEKRDDDAAYPQEEEEPKQEQDPRDVEDEASRKITNFMRRASAKNQKDKRASAVQEYLRTVDDGLAPQQEAEELRELDHPSDAHHDEEEEEKRDDDATYPQEEDEPKQEQDPRDVEDEASRKITNFMRRASAKNQKDKRASAVQEYLRTVDNGLAPQQEAEELRELDHPSDAHHDEEEEEKRDDDAAYPQEEEEPKQEQDPRDVEDEASRKITNFMRRASAKNQKDKRASAVQEYLRTVDDGLAPQQEAEELRELDHPSDAHHDEEEEEKRDDDATYPQEEDEPKQEQDPRDVEDEASRKITNFMRRASAKNQKDKRASAVQEYLRTVDNGLAPQQEAEELRELDHPSDAHHDEDEEKRNATYPQEEEEPKQEQDPRDVEDEASRKITNFMRRASAKNQKDKRASAVQEYLRTVDDGLAPQQETEELRELDHPSDTQEENKSNKEENSSGVGVSVSNALSEIKVKETFPDLVEVEEREEESTGEEEGSEEREESYEVEEEQTSQQDAEELDEIGPLFATYEKHAKKPNDAKKEDASGVGVSVSNALSEIKEKEDFPDLVEVEKQSEHTEEEVLPLSEEESVLPSLAAEEEQLPIQETNVELIETTEEDVSLAYFVESNLLSVAVNGGPVNSVRGLLTAKKEIERKRGSVEETSYNRPRLSQPTPYTAPPVEYQKWTLQRYKTPAGYGKTVYLQRNSLRPASAVGAVREAAVAPSAGTPKAERHDTTNNNNSSYNNTNVTFSGSIARALQESKKKKKVSRIDQPDWYKDTKRSEGEWKRYY
ncbi:hypothetical protein, conserved [Angomonas deanei]|uniref:Uncharacterized protein n=1 Tax=Angomonas deanei TaxID=59799 RepID=A0A7G2CBQ4_9TRYP|nr:hypothetical protein, conserved [Angomonas deanei]